MNDLRTVSDRNFEEFLKDQDIPTLHRLRFYARSISDRQTRIERLWAIASELVRRDPRY
jgi:hypothetical protein